MRFMIIPSPDPNRAKDGAHAPPDGELIAAYMKYNEDMFRAGVLVASEGINPAVESARLVVSGRKRKVMDGPFTEAKELIGGLYLIDVKSRDEAIEWALRCPVGLGFDDVLTIHPLTEAADVPPEVLEVARKAAPAWTASFVARSQ